MLIEEAKSELNRINGVYKVMHIMQRQDGGMIVHSLYVCIMKKDEQRIRPLVDEISRQVQQRCLEVCEIQLGVNQYVRQQDKETKKENA